MGRKIEEIIRGLQATMASQLEFNYYRTALRGLENFLADTKTNYALLINRGKRIELLTDKIIQIPVNYL